VVGDDFGGKGVQGIVVQSAPCEPYEKVAEEDTLMQVDYSATMPLQLDRADLKLCVDITLYWTGTLEDHAKDILRFYNRSMEFLRQNVTYYCTESMRRYQKADSTTLEMLPFWLNSQRARREYYCLELTAAADPEVATDRALSFRQNHAAGVLRLVLPLEYVQSSSRPLKDLTVELVGNFVFAYGHSGYAFSMNENDPDLCHSARLQMYPLGMRHPGIDIPSTGSSFHCVRDGIKCINWLTLLGDTFVRGFKPTEADERIVMERLPHGILIQAGPRPEMGDVKRGQLLPAYHAVGRRVVHLRAVNHPSFIVLDKVTDDDATNQWLSRFDT
jgi:hypothetical protein